MKNHPAFKDACDNPVSANSGPITLDPQASELMDQSFFEALVRYQHLAAKGHMSTRYGTESGGRRFMNAVRS